MHVPINVKSPNNISERQKGFNSAFKGLSLINFRGTRTSQRNESFIVSDIQFGPSVKLHKVQSIP